LDVLQEQLGDARDQNVDAYYQTLRLRGLEFGAAFRPIRELRILGPESIGLIALPRELDPAKEQYMLHPIVLDGAFQILGTALTGSGESGSYLPLGFESLRVLKKIGSSPWAYVKRRVPEEAGARAVVADVVVYDADGHP